MKNNFVVSYNRGVGGCFAICFVTLGHAVQERTTVRWYDLCM